MQKRTRTTVYITLITLTLALIGGSIWWMTMSDPEGPANQAPEASISSQVMPMPNMPATYDPNVDANGHLVTPDDVEDMRQKLLDAGLPADKWAPSDIKKIIVKSSTQGMDAITYARENFHGE